MATNGKYEASYDYTAADALAAAKEARMRVLLSAQEYGISGRQQKMAALKDLNDTIRELEREVIAQSGRGNNVILARRITSR